MTFWRKKNSTATQDQDRRDEALLHRPGDPALEPPTEYDAEMDSEFVHHVLEAGETEILEELEEMPVPQHTQIHDARRSQARKERAEEQTGGGWLSRLTNGLSKSSHKFTQGLTDLVTKRKLDDETLEALEDLLVEADLGPKTAAKVVKSFSEGRFGKDIDDNEVRHALADTMAVLLEPVAKPLEMTKPKEGPFVVLVVGVNGAGKTTTIGKIAHNLHIGKHKTVMIAAGDTFRAAAIEQLEVWAKRAHTPIVKKDIGADSAAVAFEAYEKAKAENIDVLLVDTAGRLQNKKNLMEELQKIIRVLKKQDENLPHAVLLVLDATTGQNAFSQVEAFKEMVNVTGLAVTKLDGSAKGGVLVGLADRFGMPVHFIGVGEGAEDLQPFNARDYARSLMGLSGE